MKKILIIQTAFIGDVILATSLIEKLHQEKFEHIDFLLRKGNEGLLKGHPLLKNIYVWNKRVSKYRGLFSLIRQIRKQQYDYVINLQRFFSTGLITSLSGAKETMGFKKNPLSFFFTMRYPHEINPAGKTHETGRNILLISTLVTNVEIPKPKLYPSKEDFQKALSPLRYVTISPTSVWFTKQLPPEQWVKVIQKIHPSIGIYLLGGSNDIAACNLLKSKVSHPKLFVKAGAFSFLESAALMQKAEMNFVNDSAPLHMASAMDAPVTAIFCSTVPAFGFGPLSTDSKTVEIAYALYCRPCGLHGYKACPEKHFKCGDIAPEAIVEETFRNEIVK